MSLSQEALTGVMWAGVEKIGGKAIQFVTTIFLARILVPEDFGVIALISIFFAISLILIDGGFSQALIRNDELTEDDKSTTFNINLITAVGLTLILWFTAPLVSDFYEVEILTKLIRFMTLIPIFFSFSIIQRAFYSQRINFRTQAKINLVAAMISGISAVVLALYDFGVWAIAAQQVLMAFITSFLFWGVNPWFPKSFIKKESFQRLFGFGSNLVIASLINVVYTEIYKVLIGKLYSVQLLGYYAQADNIKNVVSKNLIDVMMRVTYPTLSKIRDDQERLRESIRKVIRVISIIIFPALIGLILVAEPIIITLIGEKWRQTVPILQLLSIIGMIHHIQVINLNILKIIGRTDLILKIEIFKRSGATIAIFIGLVYGFWGLIIAQVASSIFIMFVNMYYSSKLIQYPQSTQLKDTMPILVYSIPMVAIVLGLDLIDYGNEILRLMLLVIVGALTYLLTCLFIKPQPFRDLVFILRPKFPILKKLKV